MKVVIIEDEYLSAERLRTLLYNIDPGIVVLAIIDSVKAAVQWFDQNEKPDLVLMDIQLADGLSFDIFDQVKIEYPIIFTTAYQEYAIKAFKVNSVDYLLKPISEEELRSALAKYQQYFNRELSIPEISNDLLHSIKQMISNPYKSRFMIKVGDRIKTVDINEILYFYSLQKGTYLHTADNRNYVIDFTLDGLVDSLDPALFHRINRRYIITHKAISNMITLSGSKLKIELLHSDDARIYISRDRLPAFKEWLDQ
ncbi:MAG: response regulator transcription factor [Bacteroidales bacterium]|nr:response regulator transcription factor [Bacteroidales bacterium]